MRIAFLASKAPLAQTALHVLSKRYGSVAVEAADVIVALGGDGFMLHTLRDTVNLNIPIYGMNRGTVGFLMNSYGEGELLERLEAKTAFSLSLQVLDRCVVARG